MDTRFTRRVNLNLKITLQIEEDAEQQVALVGGNKLEAEVFDISVSGIGLGVKHFIPKGLIVSMEIDGAPFGLEGNINMKGEVCYCNYVQVSLYKCGVRFIEAPEEYAKLITDFVAKHERRQEPRIDLT